MSLLDTGYPMPPEIPPDQNAGTVLTILTWTLFGISGLLMGGRLFSKIVRLKHFALDDGMMLIALVSAVFCAGGLNL
jgi:hypothetical protein